STAPPTVRNANRNPRHRRPTDAAKSSIIGSATRCCTRRRPKNRRSRNHRSRLRTYRPLAVRFCWPRDGRSGDPLFIDLHFVGNDPLQRLLFAGKAIDPALVAFVVSNDHVPAWAVLVLERQHHGQLLVRLRHSRTMRREALNRQPDQAPTQSNW